MFKNLTQLFKVAGLKMTPFIKSVILYFVIGGFEHYEQVWSTVLKVIPIFCLMGFIFLYGFKLTKEYRYSQLILLGLVFSCLGDALLDWHYFTYGMAAFGMAHVFYISAFGFKPLKLSIGVPFYTAGIFLVFFLLFDNLTGILKYCLPIYSILLLTMGWRSIARIDEINKLTKTLCAIGAILFVVSDSLIAFNKFYTSIPYAHILIMLTYYLAQFGITLSIVDLKKLDKSIKKSS